MSSLLALYNLGWGKEEGGGWQGKGGWGGNTSSNIDLKF